MFPPVEDTLLYAEQAFSMFFLLEIHFSILVDLLRFVKIYIQVQTNLETIAFYVLWVIFGLLARNCIKTSFSCSRLGILSTIGWAVLNFLFSERSLEGLTGKSLAQLFKIFYDIHIMASCFFQKDARNQFSKE